MSKIRCSQSLRKVEGRILIFDQRIDEDPRVLALGHGCSTTVDRRDQSLEILCGDSAARSRISDCPRHGRAGHAELPKARDDLRHGTIALHDRLEDGMIAEGFLGDPDHCRWRPEFSSDQSIDHVVDRIDSLDKAMRLEPSEPVRLGC